MKAYHPFPPVTSKIRGFLFSHHDYKKREKHKVIAVTVLLLLMVLALGACRPEGSTDAPAPTTAAVEPTAQPTGEPAPAATTEPTTAPTQAPTSEPTPLPPTPTASLYPQIHTDALGREVTIEARPRRIVSLAPSVTEILFAIGAGPQVVGRTEYGNYPPEVESLPTVGGFSASSISVETILSLEPDLVLAGSRRQEEVVEALAGSGVTVFALAPESLADIEAGILTLGQITGEADGAEAVVAEMQARMAAVADKIDTIPDEERVTVFYEVWHEPLMTTSDATYIGELLALAGGVNVFGDLEESYPAVSAEQIVALNPQAIVGPSSHGDQLTSDVIAARPGWENLAAVQNGAIYIVNGDPISRPGPRVVDALEQMAAFLYPDLFAE